MISGGIAYAIPNGGYAHPEILIQPEELKVLIDKKDPHIQIIDIREKLKYLAGHIPRFIWIEWTEALVEKDPFKNFWKSAEEIKRIYAAKGVTPNKDIFMY